MPFLSISINNRFKFHYIIRLIIIFYKSGVDNTQGMEGSTGNLNNILNN